MVLRSWANLSTHGGLGIFEGYMSMFLKIDSCLVSTCKKEIVTKTRYAISFLEGVT